MKSYLLIECFQKEDEETLTEEVIEIFISTEEECSEHQLNTEKVNEHSDNTEGHIEERNCPTPIPENVYKCAESNI